MLSCQKSHASLNQLKEEPFQVANPKIFGVDADIDVDVDIQFLSTCNL